MSGKRIAVLISGRGSNLQAFIDAIEAKQLDAEIVLVLSNKPDAAGLDKAASTGLDIGCVNHRDFSSREDFDNALVTYLEKFKVDLVILAGFMRILTPVFIDAFAGRLLNIHPSLLPKYPGLNTHQRALDAGDTQAGATVHFVTAELDGGPAILQAAVPIADNDTSDTLAQRIIIEEHCIYPRAAQWFLGGRLKLTEQGAIFDGQLLPPAGVADRDA